MGTTDELWHQLCKHVVCMSITGQEWLTSCHLRLTTALLERAASSEGHCCGMPPAGSTGWMQHVSVHGYLHAGIACHCC